MSLALVRYALSAAAVAALAAIPVACGGDATPARTALTPISTITVPNAVDLGAISPAAAIETATGRVHASGERLVAAEMPGASLARLATLGDVKAWGGGRVSIEGDYATAGDDALVWVVQTEGNWRAGAHAGPKPARFAVVAVDAHTGEALAGYISAEPIAAPTRLRTRDTFECVPFDPADVSVAITPKAAIEAVRAAYAPVSAGKAGVAWDFDRADAETVRCVDTAGGTDYFRFRWIVTVPSPMTLYDCSTPTVRQVELRRRCWAPVMTHLVDGVSGALMDRRDLERPGPLLTDADFEQVRLFAAASGWWEAWARLNVYNDSIIPERTLGALLSTSRPSQTP